MFYAIFTSPLTQFVVVRVLFIFMFTFVVARVASSIVMKKSGGRLHFLIIRKLVIVAIFIVGSVFALDQIPDFDNIFATILTGSGIAALGISLAAQQSLSNVISGVAISASKPFEVGDRIRLVNGNITGNVEDITLRHTVERTFMNSRIIIPNSVINGDMIENSNIVEERASNSVDVTITYDSDMEKAMEIIAEVVGAHPNYIDVRKPEDMAEPLVPVYVRGLSIYGTELRVFVWTASISNNFVTCSEVRKDLRVALERAGIKFATGFVAPPQDG